MEVTEKEEGMRNKVNKEEDRHRDGVDDYGKRCMQVGDKEVKRLTLHRHTPSRS